FERTIDKYLKEWAQKTERKPVLLRGARQVGKSTAVRHLGKSFESFVEINFERQPEYKALFTVNLIVDRIISQISAISRRQITAGKTLLFLDEIQLCPEAIMSLRFFKEDMPQLHVIAAGSLLEFALEELPTFGVGRIHSMFMYPMTFDEFLYANGESLLMDARNQASAENPLPTPLHDKLVAIFRTYLLIGGMPEVVSKWVLTHDYLQCQELQDDLLISYEDDFPKYKKKVDPQLLRMTLRSAATQATGKFSYSEVGGGYRIDEVKRALEMLILAGLCVPVIRTDANGLPLGSGANMAYRKILIFDPGIMLRILNMTLGDISEMTVEILTESASNLVNRGPLAELVAGLEMQRYQSPNIRHTLYYWIRDAKNSQAEIDYVDSIGRNVLPIEIKAGMKGGMKSLWIFMREKRLERGVRCSLENFGAFEYKDEEVQAIRQVTVCPLYAMSMLKALF
ncbi:MAG: AAA family ATPase, partial [Muribaculaceae bacterium]|nr:AAA family ATPase [Muribaculaceae bacterium]